MKRSHVLSAAAAMLVLAGCSTFIGGDLVREGEPVGAITLRNDSGIDIDVVTISRCNAMSHGLSVLKSGDKIPTGTSRTWQVNAGCWDLGAGRSGTCVNNRCSWNEAYIKLQVYAGRTTTGRFTAAGADK